MIHHQNEDLKKVEKNLSKQRSIDFSKQNFLTLNVDTSNERSSLTHDGNDRLSLTSATVKPIKCSHS
jgi:hypothetical protein